MNELLSLPFSLACGPSADCTGHRRDQRNSQLTCIKGGDKALVSPVPACPTGSAAVSRSTLEERAPLENVIVSKRTTAAFPTYLLSLFRV